MNLSRRAQPSNPLPESRRVSDIYRPVTTAAYGTPRPLVIGQHRVPTTIIRDGRKVGGTTIAAADNLIRYGLCEGPLRSIGTEFANQGQQVVLPKVPGQAGHPHDVLPWVGVNLSDAKATPQSLSFEVSTDLDLSGASAAYLSGSPQTDTGLTAAGQPKFATDCHVCATGSGAGATEYLVAWSNSAGAIVLYSRLVGGVWALVSTITSATINPSYSPSPGALPQPRVAAVGNLVHVVWSCLSNAAEPVQIYHAWSTNGGTSWTFGQALIPKTKVSAVGAFKLSIALHSGGEVWICFQKRNTSSAPDANAGNTMGVVVGFLPSTANASTAWVLPDFTSTDGGSGGRPITGFQGELCLVDTSTFSGTYFLELAGKSYIVRDPSVLPLGSGKAILSCVYNPVLTASQKPCFVVPIAADTVVHWDLPSAAFQLYPAGGGHQFVAHNNLADICWLVRNGYPSCTMGWTPSSTIDAFNEGSTQLIGLSSTSFALLVNSFPMSYPSGYAPGVTPTPAGNPDPVNWGAWKIFWGTIGSGSISLESTTTDLSTSTDPAFAARAFYNGNGQIFIALGKPDAAAGGVFYEAFSVSDIRLMVVATGNRLVQQLFDYFPSTALNNSVAYQFWPMNGDMIALVREDEANTGTTVNCGIRDISANATGYGDVLPSVMAKRLLAGDAQRGLDIRHLTFDTATWDKFDAYCTAMGIRFSLSLTSQEAAWPLVCNILESANAVPYRSQGLLKAFVRETATIGSYAPLPEHAAPCVDIPERDLRAPGIAVELTATDEDWNRLTVNWKNRLRAYADEPTTRQDEGSVSRRGVVPASACDWNWITTEQTALTCLWLRMRHHQRTGLIYSWATNYKYLLNEVGDIVTIADGKIAQRPVRILSITESDDSGWLEMTGEDVVVQSSAASPPSAPGGSTSASVTIASPINLPIIFIALIGGLLQVWCLLSGPSGWRGCTVQQSWDATTWETVGSCTTPSPTGHLLQDMSRLRVQPGLRVHPGLLAGAADFALGDYSEGPALPPWPAWGDFLAGNPGALLWVDGELIAYAAETDDGVDQAQCSIMRRGLYGTTRGPHPILSRVGAVTDAAFRWPIPAGNAGRTCYWRFPSFGENPANVQTYSVEIPA